MGNTAARQSVNPSVILQALEVVHFSWQTPPFPLNHKRIQSNHYFTRTLLSVSVLQEKRRGLPPS